MKIHCTRERIIFQRVLLDWLLPIWTLPSVCDVNAVIWLVQDTYPNAAIWLVRDTYPNAAIWSVRATYHSTRQHRVTFFNRKKLTQRGTLSSFIFGRIFKVSSNFKALSLWPVVIRWLQKSYLQVVKVANSLLNRSIGKLETFSRTSIRISSLNWSQKLES